ncbi:MAG: LacI family DNA-binding transcriptional regulator [Victivallaceae bacterium]|nr:LacI family DNA-binding transcriptional regulator [Victivallaceae bacterium]
MAVTLKNLAEICNVDISTISRALRNDPRVRAATCALIRTKATELGYTPNLAARNLVSGKTLNLWMIVSELNNPVEREPAQFLSRSLRRKGYELLLTLYHSDARTFNHLLSRLSQQVADGAFIIPSLEYSAPAYLPLLNGNFPLVFIDRQPVFENCTTVTTANQAATGELLRQCAAAGADYFIILTGNGDSVARMRSESALKFCTENNLAFTMANLSQAPPPEFLTKTTALISSSGIFAGKYLDAFLRQPAPRRVISGSFDSAPSDISPFYRVFVGVQDFESIAETAADLMLEKIGGKNNPQTVEIPLKKLRRIK